MAHLVAVAAPAALADDVLVDAPELQFALDDHATHVERYVQLAWRHTHSVVCIRFHVPAVRLPTLVRQEGNLGSGYKNTDLKWSRKRIEPSPEVTVQFHRLNPIDQH